MTENRKVGLARWHGILLGGASAGAARAIGIGCNLLQVPLALALLGPEGFGLWATLQASAGFISMLDLGTGYRLQNYAAESAALNRSGQIRRGVQLSLVLTLGIGALAALLCLAVGREFWSSLLGINGTPLPGELGAQLPVLLVLCALGLPANLGPRLASGLQRNWLVGVTQAAASFLSLAWIAACLFLKPSTFTLLAGLLLPTVLANAFLLWSLIRRLPAAEPAHTSDQILPGRWLRDSLPFMVPQLSGALRTTAPPFIIASLLGVAAVTPFNLIQRLLNFLTQPQQWMLDPMWSAYTDAASRRDHAWVKRALLLSFGATLALAVAPLLSAILWGPRFLEWWTDYPATALPAGLMLWLTLWQAGIAITQPFTICLNGLGRLFGQTIYGPACVLVGLVGMAWVGARSGLGAAAAPMALVTLLINLPCAVLDVRGALHRLPAPPAPV